MKIYKATFIITLTAGIFILLMGIFLQVTGSYSTGSIRQYGGVHYGVINGYSGIFLGIVVLLLSIWAYRIYKQEKEKFRKMR